MALLVVGSVAYDSVETPYDRVEDALGGSATFFSAAASFFTPVHLVAVVGSDFQTAQVDFLRERGVDFSGLTIEEGKTFRWKGRYLENMVDRETIETQLNVFQDFNPILPASFCDDATVFLANIGPELQYHVVRQMHRPQFIAMDTMNYWIQGAPQELRRTLATVDALLINDSEVRELSGETSLLKGVKKIQTMGPKTLVVKKGENGAMLFHESDLFVCPAFPVDRVFDPTGAGDTFAGGFMGTISMKNDFSVATLRQAMVFATALASFAVEGFGVDRLRTLQKAAINQRVQRLYEMTHFELESLS
ncbi:MAG TPA: PfkB family carbohydrate kinase [bacterium]|jgi:sugar/nucleoside kinase (ribokinase family)|nr:PfkB family carbohydrate kinase [bacterium]HNT64515.1 PfkB family carbohydrate kinase [bacterium]HOX84640.1 PfkB family carbohydrate kinase [bacterium]HPG45363.1 PfkB family carbohydrate kinase [bacterium]HPM96861.1 PfkB family carbohydrate kinase [bacterium]